MQINLSRALPPITSFWGFHTLGHYIYIYIYISISISISISIYLYISALITLGPNNRLFSLAQFLPMETTVRAPAHFAPFSFYLLCNTGICLYGPLWCGMPLSFGICDYNKLFFSITVTS